MMREPSHAALDQALAISLELLQVAQSGNAEKVQLLNSRRARLIRQFLDGAYPIVSEDLQTLEQISSLNRAALDHLQQNHPDAYGALADMAETHSESFIVEHEGAPYEALLIAAPVLAWTRYAIPSGPLQTDAVDARLTMSVFVRLSATLRARKCEPWRSRELTGVCSGEWTHCI